MNHKKKIIFKLYRYYYSANETRSHRSSQANTTDSRSTANNILRNANNSFGENNSFDAMQSGTSNQTIKYVIIFLKVKFDE